MRVLIVSPRWDLVGGSERYAGEVVRGLGEHGIDVRVACAEGMQDSRAEVRVCEGLVGGRLGARARAQLRAASRACDATLVLSAVPSAALAELLEGPPLVRYVQDHTLFCPGLNKLHADGSACEQPLGLACVQRYWLTSGCSGQQRAGTLSLRRPLRGLSHALRELQLLGRARRVLVASDYMRLELLRAGLPPAAIEVLPYFTRSASSALPAATLAATSEKFWGAKSGAGRMKLFCAARLVLPDKGLDFLLTALGLLAEEVKLVIAGEGPARAWLERKARDEGLESRVLFTGWISPGQMEAHYAASDCVVFPSVWNEPFGLVGIEAMAHAKPVVAFDVGGVRQWLVPDQTGSIVPPRDVAGLARAIQRLSADPELGRAWGACGAQHVRSEFDREQHMRRLIALLAVIPRPAPAK